jgi:hypothetical protein
VCLPLTIPLLHTASETASAPNVQDLRARFPDRVAVKPVQHERQISRTHGQDITASLTKMHMLTRHRNHPQKPSTISSSSPALSPSVAPRHRKATTNRLNVPSAAPKLAGKSKTRKLLFPHQTNINIPVSHPECHACHAYLPLPPFHPQSIPLSHQPPALKPTCDLQDRDCLYPPAPGRLRLFQSPPRQAPRSARRFKTAHVLAWLGARHDCATGSSLTGDDGPWEFGSRNTDLERSMWREKRKVAESTEKKW